MKPRRFIIFASIGIVSAILTILIYTQKIDFFNAIDLKLKDVRFRTRGDVEPDKRVVIVAIDEKSINELGRWPWDRRVIAKLVESLKLYGARTIAFDIVFSETSNIASDKVLSDSIKKSGNVVSGYFFRGEGPPMAEGVEPPAESLVLLEQSRIKVLRTKGNVNNIPVIGYPTVELNIPIIAEAASSAGFFNIIHDNDGILRSSNLLIIHNGYVYPSLALSALRNYLGREIILEIAPYGVDNLLIGNYRIPSDESGRLTLNYYGKGGTFKNIPATDVIHKRLKPDSLKDSLVFIGPTEVGLSDFRATPVDPVLPGVEAHATVASIVLQNRFLIRDGRVIALEIFFIIFFPLILTTLLSFIRRTIIALLFFLITIGFYLLANYISFKDYLLNTSVLFPLVSITISYLCSEAYRNLIEEKQSRFLKKAFTSYVSPDLVSEIIKSPDTLKLGGEKREITVLFSDIRGFTSVSESLTPESLVLLLNQYLGPMTNIVLKHRGTLDKYIGDAIMAIYNAPLKIEDHAVRACETAVEMVDKLKEINNTFREKDFPEIDIGIGMNTGDAIIGNMGTDIRFDYTAIGDTVNLASRLEGLNKIYETHIIVSEFTIKHLKDMETRRHGNSPIHRFTDSRFRELDLIKVKGKDKPVTIYELSITMDKALIKKFEEALGLYRKQWFKDAQEIFAHLSAEYGDKTSEIFAERCAEFMDNPPGADWDGVYIAKAK
ncbi:MAG: adenylate/guanylate cyclase domain-containing protein [Nitrospirota bacterium]